MFPETWQLVAAFLAALLIGVSKTGVPGLGILVASIFANLMPARLSSGFVLPMLILGDLIAVLNYRRHADWKQVFRLLPWTFPGILIGYLVFGWINDSQARVMIGLIVGAMVLWHLARKCASYRAKEGAAAAGGSVVRQEKAFGSWTIPFLGFGAGFTTLVANAAGPIMTLYLLAMRLPKLEFVGTAAVFFCTLNLCKVPFMVSLGSINSSSLWWNLCLAPAVVLGTYAGKWLLKRISQTWFEYIALILSAASAVKLLC